MTNPLCNCPVTIEGFLESRSEEIGADLRMDPTLVPNLIRNLREAGLKKMELARHFGLETGARHTKGPIVTETRPARDWVASRANHIAPLMAHAAVCREGTTPQRVIAAFWNHGKAVARKKSPDAVAPCATLSQQIFSQANRYGLKSLTSGLKIAVRFNRTF